MPQYVERAHARVGLAVDENERRRRGGVDSEFDARLDAFRDRLERAGTAHELSALMWEVFEAVETHRRRPSPAPAVEPSRDSSQWKRWVAANPRTPAETAALSRYEVTASEIARIQRDYGRGKVIYSPRHLQRHLSALGEASAVMAAFSMSDHLLSESTADALAAGERAQLRAQIRWLLLQLAMVSHAPSAQLAVANQSSQEGQAFAVFGREDHTRLTVTRDRPTHRSHHGTKDPRRAAARLLERCPHAETIEDCQRAVGRGRPSAKHRALRRAVEAAVFSILANREATREALAEALKRDPHTIDRLRKAGGAGRLSLPNCQNCGREMELPQQPPLTIRDKAGKSRKTGASTRRRPACCCDKCSLLGTYERRRDRVAVTPPEVAPVRASYTAGSPEALRITRAWFVASGSNVVPLRANRALSRVAEVIAA